MIHEMHLRGSTLRRSHKFHEPLISTAAFSPFDAITDDQNLYDKYCFYTIEGTAPNTELNFDDHDF